MLQTKHRYYRIFLNQAINIFWTVLCFFPIFWLWLNLGGRNIWLYISMAIALLIGSVPGWAMDKTLLSDESKFYERLGARFVRKFVQDGDIVNYMSRQNKAEASRGNDYPKGYLKTISMYERFHWICMVFFTFSGIIGLVYGYFTLGASILFLNIPYNAIPIFLQQYNKVRIKRITVRQKL